MNPTVLGLGLVVLCSCIEGFAQVAFKLSRTHKAQRLAWTIAGFIAYAMEVSLYTLALRQIDVTVAFAMGSLSFVVTAALSALVLKEKISSLRAIGLMLILSGVVFMGGQA